jgi:hypothetical protein
MSDSVWFFTPSLHVAASHTPLAVLQTSEGQSSFLVHAFGGSPEEPLVPEVPLVPDVPLVPLVPDVPIAPDCDPDGQSRRSVQSVKLLHAGSVALAVASTTHASMMLAPVIGETYSFG